ncbi:MAG TPA: hypothetical protein VFB01_03560 [Burkholderiales bacterium]|nr:hypothetical protein [Burkholderiales bacterium]
MKRALFLALLSISCAAFAQAKKGDHAAAGAQHGADPCKQIADACTKAGFIPGDWKKGDGLWRDCVDPIMQGTSSVPGATKPLPSVDPNLVAQCKAHHAKFGEGKVGSK